MHAKSIFLFAIILTFVFVGISSAAVYWDNDAGNQKWEDPLNWSGDAGPTTLPAINNISDGIAWPIIGTGVLADEPSKLWIGNNVGTSGELLIDGGDLICDQFLHIGYSGKGILRMTSGTITTKQYDVEIAGSKDNNEGLLEMEGGTINSRRFFSVAELPNSIAVLNMSGGTINVEQYDFGKSSGSTPMLGHTTVNMSGGVINPTRDFFAGRGGTFIMEMTGGSITVGQAFRIGDTDTTTALVKLNGGTIEAENLVINANAVMAKLDIGGGTLKLRGDKVGAVLGYVNQGMILGYGGRGGMFVDIVDGDTLVTSSAPDYTIAYRPTPGHGESNVPLGEITLGWSLGDYAARHDVYFGEDYNEVNDADISTAGIYKGRQDANSFSVTVAEFGKTYYWRIDEVGGAGTDVWKGNVWNFTASEYLLIDDMESYGDANTPGQPGSRMWYTWKDGEGWIIPLPGRTGNGTGSVIEPSTETVHAGTQSITFYYDNDGANVYGSSGKKYYSQIDADTADLAVGRDWTVGNPKALSLWFYSFPNNDINEQMWVKLQDASNRSAVATYPNASDVNNAEWQQWNIDLQEFIGVDLAHVQTISIGFGSTGAVSPGGSGVVQFDDIQLHPSRCVPEYVATDFTGDCITDFEDLAVVGRDWLKAGGTVMAAVPNDNNLQVYYKFDDKYGATVEDSSGNGHVGALNTSLNWLPAGGHDGSPCLNLDGEAFVSVPKEAFANVHDQITISLWVNGDATHELADRQFAFHACSNPVSGSSGRGHILALNIPMANGTTVQWEAGWNPDNSGYDTLIWENVPPEYFRGSWSHYACVKNAAEGVMRLYRNGLLVAETQGDYLPITNIGQFLIGNFNYAIPAVTLGNEYYGKVDEFRIYNYALPQTEIVSLAKQASVFQEVLSLADLHDDEVVNFVDFAVLADSWLEEQLWP